MIQLEKNECYGCSICSIVCPKKCIEMIDDNEGFQYPSINEKKCINCHLCEKKCPAINNNKKFDFEQKAYIIRDKNINRLKNSSSGSFVTNVAKNIIEKNGIVYGVAFNAEQNVEHIRISKNNENDLTKIQGSKYVACDINKVIPNIISDINNGFLVLFIGTPCQISALKQLIKNGKLITIEVVCHGTPSKLLFNVYKKYLENKYKAKIKSVKFRNKTYGYHSSTMLIKFENNKNYYKSGRTDLYLKSFFSNLCSRQTCYNCKYKTKTRFADFTIFDCWHFKEITNINDDDLGYTHLFINSSLAHAVFEQIQNEYYYYDSDIDKAINLDGSMIEHSVPYNLYRDEYYINIKNNDFKKHCAKYFKITYMDNIIEKLKKIIYYKKWKENING